MVRIIAVVGPTASGKTGIGIALAQATGGEVVSVDSMQVFRRMDIGTAKPTSDERAQIPHHLIDILDPDQEYNAGMFANDADTVIRNLTHRNKPAILVGGTSLYLRALVNGIIEVPVISSAVRNKVRTLASNGGVAACYHWLFDLDPKSAERLHPNDISRISRALEVILETGTSIQDYQEQHRFQQQRYQVCLIGPSWSREALYERINKRVYQMVRQGLIEETEGLLQMGYSDRLPTMNAIGYKQAVLHLKGELSQERMIEDIQQKSRHYAKKQLTWYKKDRSICWLEEAKLARKDLDFIKRYISR